MTVSAKSFLDDEQSFKALAEAMAEPERSEYKSYGALSLESAFPGRKMVIYTLSDKEPTGIEVITFGTFMADWDTGPWFDVTDSRGVITQIVAVPKRIHPRDIFLQVPQKFELKRKGRAGDKSEVDFVSHYAVLVKARSKEIHQVSGHTYCIALNKFKARFPDLKIRY